VGNREKKQRTNGGKSRDKKTEDEVTYSAGTLFGAGVKSPGEGQGKWGEKKNPHPPQTQKKCARETDESSNGPLTVSS